MVTPDKNKIIFYGALIIIVTGTVSHFIYDLSGENIFFGILFPVNESLWEHFKLGYAGIIASCFYDAKKIKALGGKLYYVSKLLGMLAQALLIVIIFFSYKQFYDGILVWLDILSFIIGAVICQLIVVKLVSVQLTNKHADKIGLFFIILTGLILVWFTYMPSRQSIFRDHNDNSYGIYKPQ